MQNLTRGALLAATLLGSSAAPALAGDWDPDTARILGDPSFLPLAGEIEGSFSYTYQNDRYDYQTPGRAAAMLAPSSYKRDDNDFLPTLSFGITDDISVFANLGFGNSRNQENYVYDRVVFGLPTRAVPTRAQTNFHTTGAENPTFGATWRFIDQAYAPVSIDLTGSYSPDIFQARASNRVMTGGEATGGQSGNVQLAVSREMARLTVRAYGGFGYDGRRNEIADSGFEDLRSAPHPVYTAGLQTQTRILSWLAVNAGVTAQQAVRFDRETVQTGADTSVTVEPSGTISPYAAILVPILGQHIVGEVLYQHDFVDNEKLFNPFGVDQRYFHQQSNLYTARVLFAFGGTPALLPASAPAAMTPPVSAGASLARTYLVFFDWDRADLTVRARQIVAQAAQASTGTQTARIEVNGYTDLSGTAAYNQRLSVRRAQSVEAELVRDGVARGEISIHGFGESDPLVQTAGGVREPQNRRVEIILK